MARVGGDEFALLLEDMNSQKATVELVEHILDIVGKPVTIAGRRLVPEASIGVALTEEEPRTAEELLRYADAAMYQAKRQQETASAYSRLRCKQPWLKPSELRPICGVRSGAVSYVSFTSPSSTWLPRTSWGSRPSFGGYTRREASSRLLPSSPSPEHNGLIHEIDTWVLYQATSEAKRWGYENVRFAQLSVHVNLSPMQLYEPDLTDTVGDALGVGLEPRLLTLELVESSVVDDLELARARLKN